jgi:chorismate mutase
MGVEVVVAAAAAVTESLSANIPARLIRVEPDGFLNVPLIVEAMLPLWVPKELRGLDPLVVLKANEFIPALDAFNAA